ncbi:tyrosine-type recombinase/integrase [Carboxylicivirga taeanensis]|uniref:tyrosine-type recombinase/integrase n=1 Tax=Carboxylicivirga taeanensis TaxID=1416875 RepID=UPI003F6E3662
MASLKLRGNSIYVVQYVGNDSVRKSTGIKIRNAKDWDSAKNFPVYKAKNEKGERIGPKLSLFLDMMNQAFEQAKSGGHIGVAMRYEELVRISENKKIKPDDFLFNYWDKHINYLTNKPNPTRGVKQYILTKKHFQRYFSQKNINPTFQDIDVSFYREFLVWMANQNCLDRNGEPTNKRYSNNYIMDQIKILKTVMNAALTEGKHNNTSFKSFQRNYDAPKDDVIYLTPEEINTIKALNLTGVQDVVRDYFIIGCYTALRWSDWNKAIPTNVKDGYLVIRTQKTSGKISIPIAKTVQDIWDKWGDDIPKRPANPIVNKILKDIAAMAKLPKPSQVSSHTARRSFATNLIKEGANPYDVMMITGHTTLANFEKYIRISIQEGVKRLAGHRYFT